MTHLKHVAVGTHVMHAMHVTRMTHVTHWGRVVWEAG